MFCFGKTEMNEIDQMLGNLENCFHFWQGWMSIDLTWLVDVMPSTIYPLAGYVAYLSGLFKGNRYVRYNWQASLCLPLYD